MPSRGKKRQRVFARRSRNGCQTCKNRHLRCDESLPVWYLKCPLMFPRLIRGSDNCLRLGRLCNYGERTLEGRLGSQPPSQDYNYRSRTAEASFQQLWSLPGSQDIPKLPDFTAMLQPRRRPSPPWESSVNYISPLHANMAPSAAMFLHHYQNMVAHALLGPQYGHQIALTEHFPRYQPHNLTTISSF
jgi:hypothetical protein